MEYDGSDEGKLIPLSQVPDLPFIPRRRKGRKLSISAVYRWAQIGVGPDRVRLECVQFAGTKCTTIRALREFFARLGEANGGGRESAAQAGRQMATNLERTLEAEGL